MYILYSFVAHVKSLHFGSHDPTPKDKCNVSAAEIHKFLGLGSSSMGMEVKGSMATLSWGSDKGRLGFSCIFLRTEER